MAGGALGALIYVLFLRGVGPQMPYRDGITAAQVAAWKSTLSLPELLWVNYGNCLCSIAGCFIVVAIVMAITSALGKGRLTNIVVVIFGQVFAEIGRAHV